MGFDLSSGYSFKCEIKSGNPISVTAGLACYLLNIQISFNAPKLLLPRNLTNLHGVASIKSKFIGTLKVLDGDFIRSSSQNALPDQQRTLQLELSRESISEIEKNRDSEGISLDIELRGTIHTFTKENDYIYQDIVFGSEILNYYIEQSKWIEMLRKWNYSPALNLEIIIDTNNPISLRAGSHLLEAQKLYFSNQWKQAISECRQALEIIIKFINQKSLQMNEISVKGKEQNLQERILLSISAINNICNLASHPSESDWTKDDALYVLRLTASIVSRASTLKALS